MTFALLLGGGAQKAPTFLSAKRSGRLLFLGVAGLPNSQHPSPVHFLSWEWKEPSFGTKTIYLSEACEWYGVGSLLPAKNLENPASTSVSRLPSPAQRSSLMD